MRDILSKITKWWEAGETFGLATVVRTYRSAPRDPGAALAVSCSTGNEVVGSVSGGCVEGAVYELSLDVCQTGEPVLATYGVSDDDAFAVGLTCGGIIDIFVERNRGPFPRARGDRRGGRARRAGRGRDGDRRAGPDRRPPGDLGQGRGPGGRGRGGTAAGIPARPARWGRRAWTRRSTTTSAACSPRG